MSATDDSLRELARLKQLRATDEEAAQRLGVSRRTIQRWLNSPEYEQIRQEQRIESKNNAQDYIAGLHAEVIDTLRKVMQTSRSDKARVDAAIKLGEWLGLGSEEKHEEKDDREELKAILKIIADKPSQVNNTLILPPPGPGGLLPDGFRATSETEQLVLRRIEEKRGLPLRQKIIEGEIKGERDDSLDSSEDFE